MLRIEKRPDGLLRILADGQLDSSDFDAFVPRFEALAEPAGNPMLIELGPDFAGWSPAGLWRDLRFDIRHREQFGRIGIIGDQRWEKWGTELSSPLSPGEMRFFFPDRRDEAIRWLRGEKDSR